MEGKGREESKHTTRLVIHSFNIVHNTKGKQAKQCSNSDELMLKFQELTIFKHLINCKTKISVFNCRANFSEVTKGSMMTAKHNTERKDTIRLH